MTLTSFTPAAGIINDGTAYSSKNAWYNGNLIRFREGYPQKVGGWQKTNIAHLTGNCRDMHSWQDLTLNLQLFLGTDLKAYVATNYSALDITPIRTTISLGNNPVATSSGTKTLTLTATAHGAIQGDYFTLDGLSGNFGGITSASLNAAARPADNPQWIVASVVDANTITFVGPTTASSSTSGGSNAASAAFQLNIGTPNVITSGGWGSGPWGRSTWGSNYNINNAGSTLRVWSSDNFGGDLVFCPRGGAIWYWPANSTARGVNISTLAGAANTPSVANWIMVSPADERVFAFGCDTITNPGTLDPLFIRWSSDGPAANWDPLITNSAGGLRLSSGSSIQCALRATGQILVWTESTLSALILVGGDLVYGEQLLSPNIQLASPKAAVSIGDFAIWMGCNNFYIYNGSVQTLPCAVRAYVWNNINYSQLGKVYAASNKRFREIWWFYPSAASSENDSYVKYNYADNVWDFGLLARTAWVDQSVVINPMGASTDGYIYYHESGLDDGSTNPPTPLSSYIQSGPIELDSGDDFFFMNRIIPDITYQGSTNNNPAVTYTVTQMDYPGGASYANDLIVDVGAESDMQFTDVLYTRIRGRQFQLQVESGAGQGQGVNWRLGIQRFDLQPDGKR